LCTLISWLALASPDGAQLVLHQSTSGPQVAPGATIHIGAMRIVDGTAQPFPANLAHHWSISSGELVADPIKNPMVSQAWVRAPLRGGFKVTLAVGTEEASVALSVDPELLPPLTVRFDPATLVKRAGIRASAIVIVRGPPGPPPRLAVDVGVLSSLVAVSPGEWRATYVASDAAYPEVAVVGAWRGWPHPQSSAAAFAAAVLPLSSAIVLPGNTRPNTDMTVEISGSQFGPVTSDAAGHFSVPVVVPPGVSMAAGTSVDRLGTRRVTAIDLRVPPLPRVSLFGDLFTGSGVEASSLGAFLGVVTLDRQGRIAGNTPALSATRGRVSDVRPQAPGVFVARYLPGSDVGGDAVSARLTDGARASRPVAVVAGAPVHASVRPMPNLLVAPCTERAELHIAATDARGVNVENFSVRGWANLGTVAVARSANGPPRASYLPPARRLAWSDMVSLDVLAPASGDVAGVAVADGALFVVDAADRAVPHGTVVADGKTLTADGRGQLPLACADGGVLAFRAAGASATKTLRCAHDASGRLYGVPSAPGPIRLTTDVALIDPLPVTVEAALDLVGRVTWMVKGGADPRHVRITAADGASVESEARTGTSALPGPFPVFVQDVQTGVGAVVQAAP
jgi:hypothetical protein